MTTRQPTPDTPDFVERYNSALHLIVQIEARLAYGRPIVDRHGNQLEYMDDVIRAILDDDLSADSPPEETA